MELATRYLDLLRDIDDDMFSQHRTADHAMAFSLALPAALGRRTITGALAALGRTEDDWSGSYKFFNRADWNANARFRPVLVEHLKMFPSGPIGIAADDTKTRKTGKKIASAFWQRDPLSPPFRANIIWAERFLHFALIFPLHRLSSVSARSLPIRFEDSPVVKKPGIRGSEEQWAEYRTACKSLNLSTHARATAVDLRREFDELDQPHRDLLLALDGSFCNRTFFGEPFDRIHIVARTRKDARLCFPAPSGSRRRYDPNSFTPEQVRQDQTIPWSETKIFFGAKRRNIRFKEVPNLLWRRGGGTRPLRLIVVAAVPYRVSPNARLNYRQPAYLLTDDLRSSPTLLLQYYFDRWQIEVNHREMKSSFGIGQAQVHSEKAIPRVPAFLASCYSLLHLAALLQFGPTRSSAYMPLPAWRRPSSRPSIDDLLRQLRADLNETRSSNCPVTIRAKQLVIAPAA